MNYPIQEIAKIIIFKTNQKKFFCNNMKLNHILYLIELSSNDRFGCSMIKEQFEAWRWGCVNSDVYDYYKKYISDNIPSYSINTPLISLNKNEELLIEEIIDKTKNMDGWDLSAVVQNTTPWKDNYIDGYNEHILKSEIAKYGKEYDIDEILKNKLEKNL